MEKKKKIYCDIIRAVNLQLALIFLILHFFFYFISFLPFQKMKNDKDVVHIDMRELLTTPHQQENNPFAFTPSQLSALHDPKNLDLLYIYGGLHGVAKGLFTDIHHGLDSSATLQSSISLEQVTLDPSKLKQAQHIENIASELKEQHDPTTNSDNKRTSIFGANVLPPIKGKNLLQLMWMAFQDKTLILLAVAAVVSLAVGLYEDIAVPEYDAQGNKIAGVKWVEGVAIIVAILIVVLVGSVNDYQKEKQFRKLNAKKDDRIVKVNLKKKKCLCNKNLINK